MKHIIASRPAPFEPTEYFGKNGFGPRKDAIEYEDRFEAYKQKLDLELEYGRNRHIIITKAGR